MKKKIRKITGSLLSFALAASMVMGLSGMTALADEGDPVTETQTIIVKEAVNGTADTSFDYHIYQITDADGEIESTTDISSSSSVPGADLPYTIYDSYTDEALGEEMTDEDGGFSLSADEYAEFTVLAETDWYVHQDTPEEYPLIDATADGDHASIVGDIEDQDVYGVVQYESEEEPTAGVDKSELEAEIEKAEALDENDYTSESWEALQEALENAKAVFEDPDATQEEVDEALQKLRDAYDGLMEAVTISGTKTWDDNDNQDGLRPASITVNLLADDEVVESADVAESADGSWAYTFAAMPKYDASGDKIAYTVTEEAVDEYETAIDGYDITNSHTPATGYITIEKVWDDNDNQDGVRPESVTVGIFAGNTYVDGKEITEADGWTCTFDDLPLYEDGEELEYTVYEEDVEGYTGTVDWNEDSGVVTFTNSYTPEETSVTVRKVWNDAGDQDGLRPASVTVSLLADGAVMDTVQLEEDNDWSYDFTGLDTYAAGEEIAYTVAEDEVAGYTAEDPIRIEGTNTFILVNTHEPALYNGDGDLTVTKKWDDGEDADGVRPDVIQVTVRANDEVVRQEYVTEGKDWTCTFTDLPQYENGQELTYTVEETLPASVPEDAYTSAITEADGVVTITNTHEPSPEPTVDKDALQKEYDEDSLLNEDDYTSDSWAPFEEALENAADVLADPDASQEDVDEALKELQDAKDGLQEKVAPTIEEVTITATDTATGDPLGDDNTKTYDSEGVTLTAVPEGVTPDTATVSYQWSKDGVEIPDATGATLTLDGNISDSGTYTCVVTVTNDGLTATETGEITITITPDYKDDFDEEIVPDEDDQDTWEKTESVNAYNNIEIEMSTTLPYLDGADLETGEYSIVFHDQLDNNLILDAAAVDFKLTLNGTSVDSAYYTIKLADGTSPVRLMPFAATLAAPDPTFSDGCTFHVEVDLSALYDGGLITEETLAQGDEIILFFQADLEGDKLAGSYTSTAWYEVYDSTETAIHTSEKDVVTLTTYGIEITKYDASKLEGDNYDAAALAGATLGIYSDEACTNAVTLNGEAYTAITGEDGTAAFYGLAEGTYYIKEIKAPSGYSLSDAVLPVDLTSLDEGTYVYSDKFANVPIATYSVMTEYTNLTGTGATGENAATAGENYITTLTADEGYVLPESVKVTIGGNAASAGTDYKYSRETGELTIYGTSITGDIVITAAAAEPEAFAVYSNTDNSLTFYYDAVPAEGDTYGGKAATAVYTDVDSLSVSDYSDIPWYSSYGSKIRSVVFDESFANVQPTSLAYWFSHCSALTLVEGFKNVDTSKVTSVKYTFGNCTSLTGIDVSTSYDTSALTDMYGMFHYCTKLESVAGLSTWDTSAVTTMAYMFYTADPGNPLTSVGDLSGWDTSNVTSTQYMFGGSVKLTSVGDLSKWDLSSATNISYMFFNCKSMESIEGLAEWNTENVTNIAGFFYNCSTLTSVDGISNWKTANVTNMSRLFSGCTSLESIDISGWNTGKVTYYDDFAVGCSALDWIKIGDDFDLFTKSASALVSQQYWYDSDVDGKTMSENYMIGVTNATSGNESGQYWTYTTESTHTHTWGEVEWTWTGLPVYVDCNVEGYEHFSFIQPWNVAQSLSIATFADDTTIHATATATRTCTECDEKEEAHAVLTAEYLYGVVPAEYTGAKAAITATATFSDGTVETDTKNVLAPATGSLQVNYIKGDATPETEYVSFSNINTLINETLPFTVYYTKVNTNDNSTTMPYVSIEKILSSYAKSVAGENYCCFIPYAYTDGEGQPLTHDAYIYQRDQDSEGYYYRTADGGAYGESWWSHLARIDVIYEHSWGTPTWTWSEDYTSATASVACERKTSRLFQVCHHTCNATATGDDIVFTVTKEPTDTEPGEGIYTATVTLDDGQVISTTSDPVEIPVEEEKYGVKYAVKLWGICADTYSYDEGDMTSTASLTFGPATGADHLEDYVECDSDTCIHKLSWDEIIAYCKEYQGDESMLNSLFGSCLENGCTKAVKLTPNETLFNMNAVDNYLGNTSYTGDGVSTLYYLLNGTGSPIDYACGANWNDTYTHYSSSDPANIYSRSRIRATLTGDSADAKAQVAADGNDYYGLDTLCDESNCLLSCFPSNLQDAMVPRTTLNSGNATTGAFQNADTKTTYDKLFLFSQKEIGVTYSYDDAGGDDYGVNPDAADRVAYEFTNADATASSSHYWWTRSRYSNYSYAATYVKSDGTGAFGYVSTVNGLSPGFCIK